MNQEEVNFWIFFLSDQFYCKYLKNIEQVRN